MKNQSQVSKHRSHQKHQNAIATVARFIGIDGDQVLKTLGPRIREHRLSSASRHAVAAYTVACYMGSSVDEVLRVLDRSRPDRGQLGGKRRRFSLAA